MLQIFVYDDLGARFELDLYKDEPLKLTISAEELKDIPRVNSAFSKQFRIPGTQTNSKVFKWWYEVNTVDFDITQRVAAEIHVDGLPYKTGHIRIEKAYVNKATTQIDLEIVFFGETRDFASQVGEVTLNQLDLQYLNHDLTTQNVLDSWDLQLVNGDVVYAIANRGYLYDNGSIVSGFATIVDQQQHPNSFQKQAHPLQVEQLTPMIRTKAIIDAIFATTEYTYTSDSFFGVEPFTRLYTEGIPDASATISKLAPRFRATSTGQELRFIGGTYYTQFYNEEQDNTNSFNPGSGTYGASNFLPPTGGIYDLHTKINLRLSRKFGNRTPTYRIVIVQGGTPVPGGDSGVQTAPFGLTAYEVTWDLNATAQLLQYDGTVNTAVNVQVIIGDSGGGNEIQADSVFECTGFSGTDPIAVPTLLKFDIKCIDFLKALLTRFKLIMVPSIDNQFEFEIKPWKDYIGSGDRFDWTEKLDASKDVQLTPIFFEQSQLIDFRDQPDEDFVNKEFQELNSRGYGALQFDSGSDMLKDTRKIETMFAPTPVETVEGFADTSNFVIPVFAKREAQDGPTFELPMRTKPRLLFFNGISEVLPTDEMYWLEDGLTVRQHLDQYPRFTQSTAFPSSAISLNLNWFRDTPLAPSLLNLGESVYERYWNKYVQELYSPLSRIYTAYFNLSVQDLYDLSFDDQIFVQDAWFRLLKIYDAPLTETATVKVDLVKLLDTRTFENAGEPTGDGGGIDTIVVTGGGGGPLDDLIGTWGTNDNTYGGDDDTWGAVPTPADYFYVVQACDTPTGTFIAKHSAELIINQSVNISGAIHAGICYQVVDVAIGPEDATVLAVFPDCFSCNE